MNSITWNRRIVLAAASVTLIGGGVALPATAMAAPNAAQHSVTQTPHNDDPGLQESDHSVPGTMGGDLMDPDYPPGDDNDSRDTPNSNSGSGGDDSDDNVTVGGDSGASGGATKSSGHTGSGGNTRHHGKGLDDWHDDVDLTHDGDVDIDPDPDPDLDLD
ncbi:hypothetical protein [Streptomyces sp. NPDC002587]